MSRPVWGAWIEIGVLALWLLRKVSSRPVWGAWIEMEKKKLFVIDLSGRAPYGARGLKCKTAQTLACSQGVAPRMGRVD